MKIMRLLVGKVKDVSERSTSAKILWFVAMAYVFLWVPDIDFVFIGILHHRSIVTGFVGLCCTHRLKVAVPLFPDGLILRAL